MTIYRIMSMSKGKWQPFSNASPKVPNWHKAGRTCPNSDGNWCIPLHKSLLQGGKVEECTYKLTVYSGQSNACTHNSSGLGIIFQVSKLAQSWATCPQGDMKLVLHKSSMQKKSTEFYNDFIQCVKHRCSFWKNQWVSCPHRHDPPPFRVH